MERSTSIKRNSADRTVTVPAQVGKTQPRLLPALVGGRGHALAYPEALTSFLQAAKDLLPTA